MIMVDSDHPMVADHPDYSDNESHIDINSCYDSGISSIINSETEGFKPLPTN
jgi:hypothetical protein